MSLRVKKLHQHAKLPQRGSSGAAGYDLFTPDSIKIKPGELVVVSLGISIAIPNDTVARILPRSSLAANRRVTTDAGVIDSDYRGEVKVVLKNESDDIQEFQRHDRIAQMLIIPINTPNVVECQELDDTSRGSGGFGSTGK